MYDLQPEYSHRVQCTLQHGSGHLEAPCHSHLIWKPVWGRDSLKRSLQLRDFGCSSEAWHALFQAQLFSSPKKPTITLLSLFWLTEKMKALTRGHFLKTGINIVILSPFA